MNGSLATENVPDRHGGPAAVREAPPLDELPGRRVRLLVVDDDRAILEALRRALRVLEPGWEVRVAETGTAALPMLREQHFDAVLTDMRMPGMTGAELLEEVRQLQPECVRLMFSGYADQELLNQCLGVAHQCLSKPCGAEAIRRMVTGAIRREARGALPGVRELVGRMSRLPTVPSLYTQMVALMRRPEVRLEEVGHLVAQDPGMSAKLLQLVNSAFFGLRRPISSPGEAVEYLGVETIKALVLSLGVFTKFESGQAAGVVLGMEWRHGLGTADLAKRIVRFQGGTQRMSDDAYAAGLLHDVGRLVLAYNCTAAFEEVQRRLAAGASVTAIEAEEAVFGCNHADVAAYLFGLWGLPGLVVEAIGLHHRPGVSTEPGFGPVVAVHVASTLDREALGAEFVRHHAPLDMAFLSGLGLDASVESWRKLRTHKLPDVW